MVVCTVYIFAHGAASRGRGTNRRWSLHRQITPFPLRTSVISGQFKVIDTFTEVISGLMIGCYYYYCYLIIPSTRTNNDIHPLPPPPAGPSHTVRP